MLTGITAILHFPMHHLEEEGDDDDDEDSEDDVEGEKAGSY